MAQDDEEATESPKAEVKVEPAEVDTSKNDAPHPVAQKIVDEWVNDHLRNSPLSRVTPAWNHLLQAIPHLVERIGEEL